MNWVAGKPLAKKFNAMVNHEGIFNISTMFACDIPTGLAISMGGELWEKQELWDQQDPSRYTEHWTQPMLIIHNDLDYRCKQYTYAPFLMALTLNSGPIEGGLAAFNVLQQKGIESRFLNYPDEGHFVLKRANSLHWNRTVLGWCNKFVGINDGIKLAPPVSEKYLRGRGSRKLAFRNRCETE